MTSVRLQLQLNQKKPKSFRYLTLNKQQQKRGCKKQLAVSIRAWVSPSSHTNMDPEQGQVSSARPTKLCLCCVKAGQWGTAEQHIQPLRFQQTFTWCYAIKTPFSIMKRAAAMILATMQMRIVPASFKRPSLWHFQWLYAYFTLSVHLLWTTFAQWLSSDFNYKP